MWHDLGRRSQRAGGSRRRSVEEAWRHDRAGSTCGAQVRRRIGPPWTDERRQWTLALPRSTDMAATAVLQRGIDALDVRAFVVPLVKPGGRRRFGFALTGLARQFRPAVLSRSACCPDRDVALQIAVPDDCRARHSLSRMRSYRLRHEYGGHGRWRDRDLAVLERGGGQDATAPDAAFGGVDVQLVGRSRRWCGPWRFAWCRQRRPWAGHRASAAASS